MSALGTELTELKLCFSESGSWRDMSIYLKVFIQRHYAQVIHV